MNVLGIDPSLTAVGIASARWADALRPPPSFADLPGEMRTLMRRRHIRGRLREYLRGRDVIAVEGMYSSTDRGTLDRAKLLGDIQDQVHFETTAGLLMVAPASVKIYATGDGHADKPAVLAAARYHLRGGIGGYDEADAAWIAALVHDLLGDPLVTLPATHRRALDPYRGPFSKKHPDPWIRPVDLDAARLREARRALGARA